MKKIFIAILSLITAFTLSITKMSAETNKPQSTAEIKVVGKVVANAVLIVKVDDIITDEINMDYYVKGSNVEIKKKITFQLNEQYSRNQITLTDITVAGNGKNLYKLTPQGEGKDKFFEISYNSIELEKLSHSETIEDTIIFTAIYD